MIPAPNLSGRFFICRREGELRTYNAGPKETHRGDVVHVGRMHVVLLCDKRPPSEGVRARQSEQS